MRCGRKQLLVGLAGLVASGAVFAQLPTYGVGKSATPEDIAAWNIAIGPDGRELPPGKGTAKQGAPIYAVQCVVCHGDGEHPLPGVPQLVGGQGTLTSVHIVKTVGSYYPYATSVWDAINRAMPLMKPGSLTHDEVYALTAYILARNKIINDDAVMDEKSLPKVAMPNRDGFFPKDPKYKSGYLQLWFWPEPKLQSKKP